jgi:hypothetical protein
VVGDTGLLSAVIKASMTGAGREELFVDPRPFNADDDLYSVTRDAVVSIPDSILRRRTAVVTSLGLKTVDAIQVGQNARCPGVFVGIVKDTTAKDSVHAGCPRASFYVLAVGLPRPGTGPLPNGEIYDRQNVRAAKGYNAVRVILTDMGFTGSSVHACDYILQFSGGKWTVVRNVSLMYIE